MAVTRTRDSGSKGQLPLLGKRVLSLPLALATSSKSQGAYISEQDASKSLLVCAELHEKLTLKRHLLGDQITAQDTSRLENLFSSNLLANRTQKTLLSKRRNPHKSPKQGGAGIAWPGESLAGHHSPVALPQLCSQDTLMLTHSDHDLNEMLCTECTSKAGRAGGHLLRPLLHPWLETAALL